MIVNFLKKNVICSKFVLKFVALLCMCSFQGIIVTEFFSIKGEWVTLQVRLIG